MILPITLTSVAAAAVLNIWLSIRIGMVRHARKISIGDEGCEELIRRMRAQANFIENTPIVLLLIAAVEMARGPNPWLMGVAALYMIGRVGHGVGMDGGVFSAGRGVGTMVTMLSQAGLAVWAVTIALDM